MNIKNPQTFIWSDSLQECCSVQKGRRKGKLQPSEKTAGISHKHHTAIPWPIWLSKSPSLL